MKTIESFHQTLFNFGIRV